MTGAILQTQGAGAGTDETVDSAAVWSAARQFATGVSVVTAGSGESVHGSTASSFTFISREPPLIAVVLQQGSSLLELIRARGEFGVNVLSSQQTAVARHFASRNRGVGEGQFAPVGWTPDPDGLPRLTGTVCWLRCHARRHVPAGDHEIVLAGVRALAKGRGTPLLYFAGALHAGAIQEPPPAPVPRGGDPDPHTDKE